MTPATAQWTELEDALAREMLLAERQRLTLLLRIFATGTAFSALVLGFFPQFAPQLLANSWLRPLVILTLASGTAFEWIVRRHVDHCLREGKPQSPWLRYPLTLLEMSMPAMAVAAETTVVGAYAAAVSPAVFMWFLFIVMSVLRMDFWLSVFTGILAGVMHGVLGYFALQQSNSVLPPELLVPQFMIGKSLILVVCGVLAGVIGRELGKRFRNATAALHDRNHVLEVFGQHVSPAVVDKLMGQTGEMPSEVRHVCVMFLDIRGFTAFSESRKPEEVVEYLNSLFAFMIDAVNRNGGIVNKFLGDGFMAIFGAPIADGSASLHALTAGREILAEVERLVENATIPATRVGIGLHAGEAVTGQVGSRARKEYTIIGDVVNLASRVESLCKQLDASGLVSDSVVRELGSSQDMVDCGEVEIRGRKERPFHDDFASTDGIPPSSEPSGEFDVNLSEGGGVVMRLPGGSPIRELSSSGQTGTRPPLAVLEAEAKLAERLGHRFKRLDLLQFALTHPSWRNEHPKVPLDNQRFEFMGDLIVGAAVGELLLHLLPYGAEGDLSLLHHEIVRERVLASCAHGLGVGAALRLGHGDEQRGARTQASVLADALEAVIGAVFLDAGYDAAREVSLRALGQHIDTIVATHRERGRSPGEAFTLTDNYKSAVQIQLHSYAEQSPVYTVIARLGTHQAPIFRVQAAAQFRGAPLVAVAEGPSRKGAENKAAEQLYRDIEAMGVPRKGERNLR